MYPPSFFIGKRLIAIMRARGLESTELALRSGIARANINGFRRDNVAVSLQMIARISAPLGMTPEQFMRHGVHMRRRQSDYGRIVDGSPCGEKRVLEIIGRDYLNGSGPLAMRTYPPHLAFRHEDGRCRQ